MLRLSSRFLIPLVGLVALVLAVLPGQSGLAQQAQQVQTFSVGIIGPSDGPTAQGFALALEQANASGQLVLPDGQRFTLAAIVANARSPQEVATVVGQFRQSGIVAIFGPDDNLLMSQSFDTILGAGVPVFSAATSRVIPTNPLLFFTRANDGILYAALVDALFNAQRLVNVAIFQGGDLFRPQADALSDALAQRGIQPIGRVTPAASPEDTARALLNGQPQMIVAFGEAAQVAPIFAALRAAGYTGGFATPLANDPAFIDALPFRLRGAIYAATGWSYAADDTTSRDFTRDYVRLFGEVPGSQAAAAYDAANSLFAAIGLTGAGPSDLISAVLSLPRRNGVQGVINPALGGGLLSDNAYVTLTNPYGGANIVARYSSSAPVNGPTSVPGATQSVGLPTQVPTQPLPASTATPRPPTRTPLPTNTPTATLPPTLTPIPSATPVGVWATIKGRFLNVRTGPSTDYDIIGRLNRDEQVQLIGANLDFSWFTFLFRQQVAWISGDPTLVSIFGDVRTLPIMQAPPTSTPPPPTFTPTFTPPPPIPDIVMLSASLNPPIPQPGQPFTLSVVVRNQGTQDAGQFAVATSFKPGEVYAAQIVPNLRAGQETTVNLTATVNGTGVETIAIVLDLNSEVNEGDAGEANNMPTFSYKVDRPFAAQGTLQIAPSTSVDFFGGTQDITFSGTDLVPINGALLGVLPGVNLNQVHYDLLAPSIININVGIPIGNLPPGTVVGIYTAEGSRGILRIQSYNGANMIVEFYIYS